LRILTAVVLLSLGVTMVAGAASVAPEIDPGTGMNALALAGAAIIVLRGRRAK
jgi:hypothetical protein